MKLGTRYIVTKASDDGTFEVGDHIKLDGCDIICYDAQGWINAEEVQDATKGMKFEVDDVWYNSRRTKLLAELEALDNV